MPHALIRSKTSLLGCPKLLSSPTPIRAILGFTSSKKPSVVDVLDPWCAILIISADSLFVFLYNLHNLFSAILINLYS